MGQAEFKKGDTAYAARWWVTEVKVVTTVIVQVRKDGLKVDRPDGVWDFGIIVKNPERVLAHSPEEAVKKLIERKEASAKHFEEEASYYKKEAERELAIAGDIEAWWEKVGKKEHEKSDG